MLFSEILNRTRRESVELLSWYLQNPGRFSILILGKVGVGKEYWVKALQENIQDEVDCAKKVVTVNLGSAQSTYDYWEDVLKKADKGILLIKELEKVKPHEDLLFEALSTSDGRYGFQSKEYEIRVVFTTNFSIHSLRNTEEWISHRLFDRISQLVVRFPSYDEANKGVWEDFQATWKKMSFAEHNRMPGQNLRDWLEGYSQNFYGNFRDLDKIAILWHQFRLMGKNEKEILTSLLEQFQTYSSFPEVHTDMGDVFVFQKGKPKKQLDEEYRAALRLWATNTYGSLRKAGKALKISHRTMERW